MATTTIKEVTKNVNNLKKEYAKACNSFNFAVRFIFDLSKESVKELPAVPSKDDKSPEATDLRMQIATVKKYNDSVETAKYIVNVLGIDSNSIKTKNVPELRTKILAKYPYKTESGVCVTFGNLPKYMAKYKDTYTVTPASWIEVLARSSKNDTDTHITFETVTAAPIVENGELIDSANEIFVDKNANIVKNAKNIREDWNKLAIYNNIANKAGQTKKNEVFKELTK